MKKYLILLLAIIVAACTSSTEDKVKNLAINEAKRGLANPESFDTLSVVVDTSFVFFDDNIIKNANDFADIRVLREAALRDVEIEETAYRRVKALSKFYTGARNDAAQYKRDYDSACQKATLLSEKYLTKKQELEDTIKNYNGFRGYRVTIEYKSDGKIHHRGFYIDKNVTKVIATVDFDSEDYMRAKETLQWLLEE